MKLIFGIIAFLITYGSLYPFNFSIENYSPSDLRALFNFNLFNSYASDLLANIVLFIPFGLLVCAAFPKNLNLKKYAILLLLSFCFAFVIQVIQLWTVGRVPWGGDAIWNTIGSLIGFVLFSIVNLDSFKRFKLLDNYKQISIALGATIIIFKLAPFAPSLDFQVLKDNIKALLANPQLDWYWTYESTVFWLCAFYLLKIAIPKWASLQNLSVVVGIVLGAQFIIISSDINLSKLAAGIIALVVWGAFHQKINAWFLAILMLMSIVANGLYPFELRESVRSFNWLPFSGSMGGNIVVNIIAMIKKLIFYGSSVWLIYLASRKLLLAAVLSALVVFCSEFMQQYFTNSVPEITDTFIVAFISIVFYILLQNQSKPPSYDGHENQTPENTQHNSSSRPSFSINLFEAKAVHQSANYIAGLDGLRAIAALAVFVVHFQQFSDVGGSIGPFDFERWMINGNTGVALFFILSGFLLSTPFWQKMVTGERPVLKQYFTNRIIRIVPIYYLCMFGIIALKGFSGSGINFNNIASHLFFLHNFKDYQVMSLNPPFWTLAVEFQFYLLLPLLFLALFKLGIKRAQLLCLLLIPLVYIAYRFSMQSLEAYEQWPINFPLIWPFGVHIESVKGQALTYSLFAHLPHFLLGIFAASLLGLKQTLSPRIADGLFWTASLFTFIILATSLDDIFQLAYGRYNFPTVPILLVIIVFTAPISVYARKCLELGPIKWMGVISYGVYVFHYPVQNSLARVFAKADLALSEHVMLYFVLSLIITLVVSHLSFVILEKPILQYFRARKSASVASAKVNRNSEDNSATSLETAVPSNSGTSNKKLKSSKKINGLKPVILIALLVILTSFSYRYFNQIESSKIIVKQASWGEKNTQAMVFDHHAHTRYSDGTLTIAELTELAFFKGCNAFSITDHTNTQTSFSLQKLDEIQQMREAYPGILIFAGLELGMPSYEGREHINIITTPEYEDKLLVSMMNKLANSSGMNNKERDLFVLNALVKTPQIQTNSIAIYNHPSRKDINEEKDENLHDILYWNKDNQLISAIAGAPGHQRKSQIGSYETLFETVNRWDPAVAKVGGTWDTLLSKGHKIWGAIASSDYHGDYMDYAPCEFSRIHVQGPEFSHQGLMAGLKAGTFWADHGKLLSQYNVYASVAESPAHTHPGGTLVLPKANLVTVNIDIKREQAFENDFMRVDLISNCGSENVNDYHEYLPPEKNKLTRLFAVSPASGNCFVRSRVVRETPEKQDLSAYSNPIFIEFDN